MDKSAFLKVAGRNMVNGRGEPVLLRGTSLGGWLNMENFITGYPSSEQAHRAAILKAVGPEKYRRFFDRLLSAFFAEADADFIKSLGMNLVRIPINYRHLEDDMRPFVIKDEGFRLIDRAVSLCAERGIYTILDLHALPGYQNQAWHSDNPTHKALFWEHRHAVETAMRFVVVGHALLEKVLAPYPAMTGKCLLLGSDSLDPDAAEALAVTALGTIDTPRQLAPLPIQGIPGWDAVNANAAYYANREIFRPAR